MKKLIAILIGASVISSVAMAEDNAQQAATPNNKSDAVMQQLADNSATGASSDATAGDATKADTAKKGKKHCSKHKKHHRAKKAKEAKPADASAPAADANAPASN